MTTVNSLSLQTARHLHLAAQGLLRPLGRRARFADIHASVRQMSLLQIDTINVVARSPYLVLFSRLGAYPTNWLEETLAGGELFEYWAHEACFIPFEDYPLLRHRMLEPQRLGWKYSEQWVEAHQQEITDLLAHISENGPVRAADFANDKQTKPGWWAWKPHKRHLENLFSAGELMVVERRNFQRVYDLRSRVMPEWNDAQHALSEAEAVLAMLNHSSRSLGIFRANWLADYYRLKRAPIKTWLEKAEARGDIVRVEVEQLGEMWLHKGLLPLLEKMPTATHTALLSPFDPVVWDRRRALELFNFDYRIECYTPAEKRKYGYFVLPVLHRGALKARIDAKMERQSQQLVIRAFWLEPGTRVSNAFLEDVQKAINRFAQWQGASQVILENAPPALLAAWSHQWDINR
ncbi:winged helix-turn-helix domain-containing protein [Pantoea sp. EA-12]|uniref:winged helix-turn-helix domain-containing protein n=1 Tax=Pantoea sp. EA-12 TaxID=3043303 RepID=UPI0024B51B2F|nr:winged helix-turn-helix domain-containing protein [Pantoea sp. EA-12]MDI9222922.1 winged helix-turn-helix domain-containing protein [Pantoea sp. EA-12]